MRCIVLGVLGHSAGFNECTLCTPRFNVALPLHCLSLFGTSGVSYAAAVLATRIKTSSGVLTDASTGQALVTAGASAASMTSFTAASSPVLTSTGGPRLLTAAGAGAAGQPIFSRRRRMVHDHSAGAAATAADSAGAAADALEVVPGVRHGGRRLAVLDSYGTDSALPQDLVVLGSASGAAALEICRMTRLGLFEIYLPGFGAWRPLHDA